MIAGLVAAFSTPPRKPEDEESDTGLDPALIALTDRVVTLDELRAAGAVFVWPDALDVLEWAGLVALGRARAKIEKQRDEAADVGRDQVAMQQRTDLVAKARPRG